MKHNDKSVLGNKTIKLANFHKTHVNNAEMLATAMLWMPRKQTSDCITHNIHQFNLVPLEYNLSKREI